jgi:hypothetical protein
MRPQAAQDRVPGRINSSLGNSLIAFVAIIRVVQSKKFSRLYVNPALRGVSVEVLFYHLNNLFGSHVTSSEARNV